MKYFNVHRLFLIPAALVAMAGCATAIPRGVKVQSPAVRADLATVYVFHSIGGAIGPRSWLMLNGTKIGALKSGEYTWFYATPGVILIGFNDAWAPSRKLVSRQLPVAAGQSYYLKYRIESDVVRPDGVLLLEMITGASRDKTEWQPQNLHSIGSFEAKGLISVYTLLGNSLDAQQTVPGKP